MTATQLSATAGKAVFEGSAPVLWLVATGVIVLFFLVIFLIMRGRLIRSQRLAEAKRRAYFESADGASGFTESEEPLPAEPEPAPPLTQTLPDLDPEDGFSTSDSLPAAERQSAEEAERAGGEIDLVETPKPGVFAALFARKEKPRAASSAASSSVSGPVTPSAAEPAQASPPMETPRAEPVRFDFGRTGASGSTNERQSFWTEQDPGLRESDRNAEFERRKEAAALAERSRSMGEEAVAGAVARALDERLTPALRRLDRAAAAFASAPTPNPSGGQTPPAAAFAAGDVATRADLERFAALLGEHLGEERAEIRNALGELKRAFAALPTPAAAAGQGGVSTDDLKGLRADLASLRAQLRAAPADAAARPSTPYAFAPSLELADVLRNALPRHAYELGVTLSTGRRADCLLKLPEPAAPIAIDARFPIEAWHRLSESRASEDPHAREEGETEFRRAVLRHVVDVAERLIGAPETASSALMFAPSETIHADLCSRFHDVVQDSYRARVFIVSPTSLLATLHAVRATLLAGPAPQTIASDTGSRQTHTEISDLRCRVERLEETVGAADNAPSASDFDQRTDAEAWSYEPPAAGQTDAPPFLRVDPASEQDPGEDIVTDDHGSPFRG